MKVTASRVLLALAALCGVLVAFGVSFGDLDAVRLLGGSLFFGWLASEAGLRQTGVDRRPGPCTSQDSHVMGRARP